MQGVRQPLKCTLALRQACQRGPLSGLNMGMQPLRKEPAAVYVPNMDKNQHQASLCPEYVQQAAR
jgi:hypothetical protein